MKKYLMTGIAALTLCAGFTSCSHDFEPMTQAEIDKAKYDQAFLKYVGGKIAADQDWGFGTTTALTRAAASWDGNHTCLEEKWEDKLKNITLPNDAFQLDQEGNFYYNQWLWPEPGNVYKIPNNATIMYLSKDFNGEFSFEGNIPAGATLYNYGTVTGFSGNFSGTITIYNLGTMTYNPGSQDHNVINTGTLYVKDNDACAKILKLYNGGHLEFLGNPAQLHSKSTYYSNGEGTISMPYGGVIESACDIHGTINATGDLNIQTGTTDKKICGIVATGRIQNTAGRLETSYMEAADIYFEGNHLYLYPGAHVKAGTLEFDKAACDVHAAENSNALVEATKNISFKNDNDFNRTFSDNIYFKIDGSINMNGQTNGGFTDAARKLYNNADEYITAHGNPNNKLNAGTATGSPECGKPWTVGTPKQDEFTFLCRVFAEDLSANESTDFDFNDVVFDVYTNKENKAKVVILAAGGTLPLYVAGQEVHGLFGNYPTDVMINTNAKDGEDNVDPVELPFLIEGVSGLADVNKEIEVKVVKNNVDQVLTAIKGEPAAKFAVTEKIQWVKERKDFSEEYPNFKSWAKEGTPTVWWK